eukprot:jgi/Botrbrau1/9455/Bobra.0252s0076.1
MTPFGMPCWARLNASWKRIAETIFETSAIHLPSTGKPSGENKCCLNLVHRAVLKVRQSEVQLLTSKVSPYVHFSD